MIGQLVPVRSAWISYLVRRVRQIGIPVIEIDRILAGGVEKVVCLIGFRDIVKSISHQYQVVVTGQPLWDKIASLDIVISPNFLGEG